MIESKIGGGGKVSQYFIRRDTVRIENDSGLCIESKLPCGTYLVSFDDTTNSFFLEKQKDLEIPEKIYGNLPAMRDRIISTYESRDKNTGVLLSGDKGSGKTLLVDMISKSLLEKGVPTIIVSKSFNDSLLAQFIRKIDDKCVVVFDEFEKLFEKDNMRNNQKGLLSLFDGVFQGKFLFMLTINEIHFMDTNLLSRPGRMFYHLKFNGVEKLTVEEYCRSKAVAESNIKEILTISQTMGSEFSFDVLKALVEESNRYGEPPIETLRYLNIEPSSYGQNYSIESLTVKGQKASWVDPRDDDDDRHLRISVLSNHKVYYYLEKDKDDDPVWKYFYIGPKSLVEKTDKTLRYEDEELGICVVLKKHENLNWVSLL